MKQKIIKIWNKLTFGNSGSAPAERVVNVIAVIICAPILPYQWWKTRHDAERNDARNAQLP